MNDTKVLTDRIRRDRCAPLPHHPAERIALLVVVPGGDVPATCRLRTAIKHLWRTHRIRLEACVSVADEQTARRALEAAAATPGAAAGVGGTDAACG